MEPNNKGAKLSMNSLGSLFHDSFALYSERFTVLSEIIILPVLIMVLGYIFIFLGSPFVALGTLIVLIGVVVMLLASLATIFSIKHNAGVDASYRGSLKFFWSFIWISILTVFVSLGGFTLLIIPGIWIAIATAFKAYTLVIENRKGMDALRQSKAYVSGYWWPVLGRTALMLIIFIVLSAIIRLPLTMVGGLIGSGLGSLILIIFIVPFSSVFLYKMFENLQALKPELHSAPRASATVLNVFAIIGIIAAVFLIAFAMFGLTQLAKDYPAGYNMNENYYYNNQFPPSNQ